MAPSFGMAYQGFPNGHKEYQQGMCHNVALPFTFKKIILKQNKNYGNSIFHHAKI
jgi:hypothetical protein